MAIGEPEPNNAGQAQGGEPLMGQDSGVGQESGSESGPESGKMTDNDRQRRLSVLARAPSGSLLECWKRTGLDPAVELLRGPETGLIALRGRIGGGGQPFHAGEMSATRVTVRIGSGQVGHAMIAGRDARKAQLVAVIDALSMDPAHSQTIEQDIVRPLEEVVAQADAKVRAETAATKVNFFTMVRGED